MSEYQNIEGFTLYELMFAVALVAILIAVSAPSFTNLVQNQRLTTQVNALQASLALARSEAITRGQRVSLDAQAAGWNISITPLNVRNSPTPPVPIVLRTYRGLNENNTLTLTGNSTQFTYDERGLPANGATTFLLTDNRGQSRTITINALGHTTVSANSQIFDKETNI